MFPKHEPIEWYGAAAWDRRQEMQEIARKLISLGDTVPARWLIDGDHDMESLEAEAQKTDRARFAKEDLEDIANANGFFTLTEPRNDSPFSGGGRHVEFGFAYAKQIVTGFPRIVIIGHYENVFHYMEGVEYFQSVNHFLTKRAEELRLVARL